MLDAAAKAFFHGLAQSRETTGLKPGATKRPS